MTNGDTRLRKSHRRALWQAGIVCLALTAPFALLPGLIGPALAQQPVQTQEMEKPDTRRVVSIGGAVTEIIFALGEEHRLIARDSTSLYPQAALALPDVGYMRQLSPEGVIATDPTAVIAIEGSGPPEALSVLKQAKVAFATIPDHYDAAGIVAKIVAIGDFLDVPDKAQALAETVKADLDAAIAAAERRPPADRKRVLFILSMQGGKILASGAGTAADGIIKLSGSINATGNFNGYKPLTDEAIIAARPDVVLMMTRGGEHAAGNEEIFTHPALKLTPAAATGAIVRMDGLQLLGFGPRTAGAIRDLDAALYAPQTTGSLKGAANGAQ